MVGLETRDWHQTRFREASYPPHMGRRPRLAMAQPEAPVKARKTRSDAPTCP